MVLGQLSRGKLPANPKITLTLIQTLTLTGGQFLSGAILQIITDISPKNVKRF